VANHFEYSEVHVLYQNNQTLALANMAKSANDMMTRPHLRGCSGTSLTMPAYCHGHWGSRGKAPAWGSRLGTRSPEA